MTIYDDELRAHFGDLRAEDAAAAPVFALPPASAPRPSRSSRAVWLAAAAVVAIAATLVVLRERPRVNASVVRIDSSVLNWASPTDGLLRDARALTSRASAPSSVFGSVLDGAGSPSKGGGL